MTTTVDVVFAFDCSSSMDRTWNKVRADFFDPMTNILRSNSDKIRLGFIGFGSHSKPTTTFEFTSLSEQFRQYLDQIRISNEMPEGPKGVALALEDALNFDWRPNDLFSPHEKILILFTNGPPCGLFHQQNECQCSDLLVLAEKYLKKGIMIVVVGVEPDILIVDDLYCGLAKKTGGEYLPLVNASRILLDVLSRSLIEEETLGQLFRQLDWRFDVEMNSEFHFDEMKNRVDFVLKRCRTMSDVRQGIYWYLRLNNEGKDAFPCFSPTIRSNCSSPISIVHVFSDDEGYRSALPTVASNSSFLSNYQTNFDDELFSPDVFI